jgi:predicted transcriptional regulator
LERTLLQLLWTCGNATVRELLDTGALAGAYTTVMTTLDRMHKKGLLLRKADGRAFRYSPAQTEQEFNDGIARTAIEQWLRSGTQLQVSFLVDTVTEHDRELLDDLERAIERKRQELNGGKSKKEKR